MRTIIILRRARFAGHVSITNMDGITEYGKQQEYKKDRKEEGWAPKGLFEPADLCGKKGKVEKQVYSDQYPGD